MGRHGRPRRAARRLQEIQPICAAAARQGQRRQAAGTEDHPLSGGDRQHRSRCLGRSHCPGARLRPGNQLHRRRRGEDRRHPVHHRAAAVSGEAAAGAGGRGLGAGARWSTPRPTSPARNRCSAAPSPRCRTWTMPGRSATPRRRTWPRPRPTPSSPRSTTATPACWRRSTAGCRPIWSRSATWSAPRRPSWRPSCRCSRST